MEMDSRGHAELREQPSAGRGWIWLICGITLVAVLLRFYGLLGWPMRGDEPFSIRWGRGFFTPGEPHESAYPSYFFLLWLIFKALGCSAAKDCLIPARVPMFLLAVATFPLFWLAGKRAFGRAIAAVAIAMIALTEWHILHSKLARYYPAVFLFGGLSALFLYSAVEEGKPWRALAALVLGGVGASFHPTGAFVIGGGVCYVCVLALWKRLRPPRWSWQVAIWYLAPIVLAGLIAAPTVLGTMRAWSDKGLLWNYTPMHTLLGIVRNAGLVVTLAAVAGVVVCAFKRVRLAVFGLCWCVPGMAGLVVLSPLMDVRPDFLFSIAPGFYFLAAGLCVVPFVDMTPGRARGVCIVALGCVVALSQVPPTLSHFTERAALDPRPVVAFIEKQLRTDDALLIYMSGFGGQFPGHKRYRMARDFPQLYEPTGDWQTGFRVVEEAPHRTWFVFVFQRAGVPPPLDGWLRKNARLIKRWRAKRFDYLSRDIEVWLYDPGEPAATGQGAPAP